MAPAPPPTSGYLIPPPTPAGIAITLYCFPRFTWLYLPGRQVEWSSFDVQTTLPPMTLEDAGHFRWVCSQMRGNLHWGTFTVANANGSMGMRAPPLLPNIYFVHGELRQNQIHI